MGKKKKFKNKNYGWILPTDYKTYFYASSDDEFEGRHPIGYFFLVILGISILLLPAYHF
ncbi:MAG: hypothetical protein LUG91_07515 [Ruminococcus sp.]|nr:hypothetical protein [Ruminococcus sp.]